MTRSIDLTTEELLFLDDLSDDWFMLWEASSLWMNHHPGSDADAQLNLLARIRHLGLLEFASVVNGDASPLGEQEIDRLLADPGAWRYEAASASPPYHVTVSAETFALLRTQGRA